MYVCIYIYTNIIWGDYAKFKTKPFCILSAWSLAAHLSYPGALQTCVFWGLEFKELSFLVKKMDQQMSILGIHREKQDCFQHCEWEKSLRMELNHQF